MTEDPIAKLREVLDKVAGIKIPSAIRVGKPSQVKPDENVQLPPQEKISQLESYLLLTAEARQLALASRLAASDALHAERRYFAESEGWQNYMEGRRKDWTQPQVAVARRRMDPERYAKMERLEWLVREFDIQIRRLEADDAVASRAYTMITGS